MRSYIDRGYTVVKKKIGGASLDEDLRRIDAILSVLQDGQKLCVDANGRFDLDTAIAYAKALSQYDLFWYEEPGDPLDFELQATLRNYYKNPMATGEDLFSMQDARNLIRYGGMRPDRDWLQFDCALSYGLVEYLRTLDMLKEHGWSASRCIPHGGHQMSLNIAAGLGLGGNESYPDLFQPFGGFPDGVKVENSYVTLAGPARHRLRRQGRPVPRDARPCPPDASPPTRRQTMTRFFKRVRARLPALLACSLVAARAPMPPTPTSPSRWSCPSRQVARATRSPATWQRPCASRWARRSWSTTRPAPAARWERRVSCARRPDGYTLLIHHIGLATAPALYKKLGYKTEDLEFLGLINEAPSTLIGKQALPAANFAELRKYIAANAGKVNLANAGVGSASHLCSLHAAERAEERHDLRALQGHRAGDERPARRHGGSDVRAGDQQHAADRGQQGQGLWRDQRAAHEGAGARVVARRSRKAVCRASPSRSGTVSMRPAAHRPRSSRRSTPRCAPRSRTPS